MKSRKRIQIFSLLMSLSIILNGSSNHKFSKVSNGNFSNGNQIMDELIERNVNSLFSTSNNFAYHSPCSSFFPDYEESMEILNQISDIETCHFKFDGNIENLISKICDNSSIFLEKNTTYQNAFYSDKVANKDLEVALSTVLTDYYLDHTNDINEDFCKMQSLKIVFGKQGVIADSFVNPFEKYLPSENKIVTLAYYIPRCNLIVLNIDAIQKSKNESILLWEEFAYILRHELNHLRQYACDCRKSFLLYPRISLQSENSSFLIESSAESEVFNVWNMPMINEYKYETGLLNYKLERKYEAMLFILTLGRDDVSLNDYYNALFDSDINQLFSFLGAFHEEDKREMYFILSSMDTILFDNDSSFLYYNTLDSLSYNDSKKAVGFDFKILIFKRFLAQMKEYTNNQTDFSLEENVYLFDLIQQILVNDSFYYEEDKKIVDERFLYQMELLEKDYFSFLENFYQRPVDSVWDNIRNPMYTKLEEMETFRMINSSCSDVHFYYVEPVYDLSYRFPILSSIVFASSYQVNKNDEVLKNHNPKIRNKVLND